MNRKKITTIAACLIMALSLTACGSQTSQPGQEGQSSQPAQNTQTADSSSVTEQDLLDEENKILSENQELWEKVFGAMDKNVTDSDLSKNYGSTPLKRQRISSLTRNTKLCTQERKKYAILKTR